MSRQTNANQHKQLRLLSVNNGKRSVFTKWFGVAWPSTCSPWYLTILELWKSLASPLLDPTSRSGPVIEIPWTRDLLNVYPLLCNQGPLSLLSAKTLCWTVSCNSTKLLIRLSHRTTRYKGTRSCNSLRIKSPRSALPSSHQFASRTQQPSIWCWKSSLPKWLTQPRIKAT